ncbi:MAG: hypothetical protein HYW37_02105 [Candidatus Colwellbacteria bacterium]|nr:hypothetical protein [Candidatus Colwellbacteria bacterium]
MTKFLGTSLVASFLTVALAIPVVAQTQTTPTTPTTQPTTVPTAPTKEKRGKDERKIDREERKVDVACIQTAVSKRESALTSGLDIYTGALKTAFSARQSALNAAWALTDRKQRKETLRTAWSTFRDASKKAQKDWKTAKRAAWDTYTKDRKACGPGVTSDDPSSRGSDEAL